MSNTIINGGASPYPKHVGPAPICSFSDGAQDAPLKSLVFSIEPQQDLHGYSYPWPGGGGVNKFDGSAVTTTHSSNWGIDWNATTNVLTITQKTSYTTGTPTFAPNLPSGTYVASYQSISGTGKISLYTDGSWVKSLNNGVTFTIDSTKTNEIRFAAVAVTKFQIESGSTATPYSPYSNISPISGWSQVDAVAAGKNLCGLSFKHGIYEVNTGTYYSHEGASTKYVSIGEIPIKGGQTYTISWKNDTTNTAVASNVVFFSNGSFVQGITLSGSSTFTAPVGADSVGISSLANTAITSISQISISEPQLVVGSIASPYAAPTLTPIPIALGQTVYSGTVDALQGDGESKYDTVTLDGTTLTYAHNGGGTGYTNVLVTIPGKANGTDNILSDRFVYGLTDQPGRMNGRAGSNKVEFSLPIEVSTVNELKAWFASNPTQLVYELASPITLSITPVSVNSLLGQNNIWASTGDTELDYYPAAASVVAVLNRSSKMYTSIPLGKIRYDTYQTTPNQALDLDSYRAETGVLIRNVLSHTATKIEFNTPSMTNLQWEEVWNIIKAGFNNSTERKLKLKYYDQMSATYKTGWFYVPDVNFTIRNIDEANGIINYDEVRVAFIEY